MNSPRLYFHLQLIDGFQTTEIHFDSFKLQRNQGVLCQCRKFQRLVFIQTTQVLKFTCIVSTRSRVTFPVLANNSRQTIWQKEQSQKQQDTKNHQTIVFKPSEQIRQDHDQRHPDKITQRRTHAPKDQRHQYQHRKIHRECIRSNITI
ncbi:hypothetical protein D3C87_1241130 [compost metagenome]